MWEKDHKDKQKKRFWDVRSLGFSLSCISLRRRVGSGAEGGASAGGGVELAAWYFTCGEIGGGSTTVLPAIINLQKTHTDTDSLTVLWIYQVAKVSALEVICHIHFGSILVFSDDLFTKLLSFSEFLNCQVNCINKALPPNILTVNRKTWASCWMSVT